MSRRSLSAASCALLLAVAAGCGTEVGSGERDAPGRATDSTSQPPDSPDRAGRQLVIGDTVEPGRAVIVSASNVDGETSTRASALDTDEALDRFLAPTDPRLSDPVRAAAGAVQVPTGDRLFGAVVSVGCDKPVAITWTTTTGDVEVSATLPKSGVQCLVPVTSVALFLVPG